MDEESYTWLTLSSDIGKTHQWYFDKQVEQGIRQKDPNFKKGESHHNTWEWKGWTYVPARKELCKRAIAWHHNAPLAGHPGITKTLEFVAREFWWPNMKKDIEIYIKVCHQSVSSMPSKQTGLTTLSCSLSTKQNSLGTMGNYQCWSDWPTSNLKRESYDSCNSGPFLQKGILPPLHHHNHITRSHKSI